jgi:hypothetical protein
MQIRPMTLSIGDPPQGLYSWWKVEPFLGVINDNPQSLCQQLRPNTWQVRKLPKKPYGWQNSWKNLGTWKKRRQWWFNVMTEVQYHWQRIPHNMPKQNRLMFNITLFENELKMVKSCLNIVQKRTWWQIYLPKHYWKNDMFGLETS